LEAGVEIGIAFAGAAIRSGSRHRLNVTRAE
jgi:hypothetical protein